MKENILFISNHLFIDTGSLEGGVKSCTSQYLQLLRNRFEVIVFPVAYRRSFFYRMTKRLHLNIYQAYDAERYADEIIHLIGTQRVRYVFLNLSNTDCFAKCIKVKFHNRVKIILCSHGNESGDFLHEIEKQKNIFQVLWCNYILGKLLFHESQMRKRTIDAVLTVSDIEAAIEKWLGIQKVMVIPRMVTCKKLKKNVSNSRIGFIGDLRHWPNQFGLQKLCEAFNKSGTYPIIRAVGVCDATFKLSCSYSFIEYLNYLNESQLEDEMSTWSLFVNPVWYFSRGVSTKLEKALQYGIPVVSSVQGLRGYEWKAGRICTASNANEMVEIINGLLFDPYELKRLEMETSQLALSTPTIDVLSQRLTAFINEIDGIDNV